MKNSKFTFQAIVFILICLLSMMVTPELEAQETVVLKEVGYGKAPLYETSYTYEHGDGSKAIVKFYFAKEDYQNFKITRAELTRAIMLACVGAQFKMRNSYSWRFSKDKNFIMFKDNQMSISTNGSAENGFGSRGGVYVIHVFKEGEYEKAKDSWALSH